MESTDLDARPSLCSLPTEVKQKILCHLPDLYALKAAILSHRSIYSTFLDGKELIALRVLLNFIPSGLIPDAALTLDASTIEDWVSYRRAMFQNWSREKVLSTLDRHRSYKIPKSISLKDAFSM